MAEYIDIEQAKTKEGMRIIAPPGRPNPWAEGLKGNGPHPTQCEIEGFQAGFVHLVAPRGTRIADKDGLKTAIGRFTGSGCDTHVARYASHHD